MQEENAALRQQNRDQDHEITSLYTDLENMDSVISERTKTFEDHTSFIEFDLCEREQENRNLQKELWKLWNNQPNEDALRVAFQIELNSTKDKLTKERDDWRKRATENCQILEHATVEFQNVKAERDHFKTKSECKVCYEVIDNDEYFFVFIPCGHKLCKKCEDRIGQRCPICQKNVYNIVRLYD